MKKFSIFLLLMAFFAPLAMNAQNRSTLTVYGDNTTTNEYVPIYGYWADSKSKCEFIIPKEKISSMNGGVVSAMKFYLSSSGSDNQISATFTVFVKEVSATTLSAYTGNSDATTVFNQTITIPTNASNVELDIPFSSNYVYNGGNLLVGFYQTGSTSYNHTYWSGESQSTNTAWSGYGSQTGSARKFLPKTTFTYEIPTTPTITLPATATVLTGFTTAITANTFNVTGTPSITYASSKPSVAMVTGSGTTATVTGVSAGTATITATMTYNSNTYTAQCAITVEDPSYCTPAFSYTSDYITSFTTTEGEHNISNTNNSQGTGGYTDYYNSHYVSAEPGTTINFSVNGTDDTYYYGLWVDWNKDYEFDNSTEKVASTTSKTRNWSSNFTIPTGTAAGDYHMRVVQSYSSAATPCISGSWGEGEDYKLTVLASGAYTITCATTTNGSISVNHATANQGDMITVTATPDTNYELTALSYNDGTDHSINFSNNQGSFTMPAANVTVSATFSIMRNLPPYDLTVGTPGGHSVVLGWTGVSTNTNHQNYEVYYSTTNTAPSDNLSSGYETTTTESYTLMGLTAETTYYAWVRDNCGTDGKSAWVAFTSFTTDVTCPAPTNVAANHVTNNSAEISFDGADNYNIRYCTMVETTYDFEDGGWSGWTYYDNDGDNKSWIVTDDLGEYSSGDTYVASHGGAYYLRSTYNSSALTENWLISPQINLGGSISFYTERLGGYDDYFKVYVSTTGTSISDFTVEIQGEKEPATNYELVTIDLSNYSGNGYVAIKHYAKENDQAYIFIDDITILEPSSWQNANSHTLTGLDPETTYQVQVQANCGSEDGTSAWVGTTFTTLSNCSAPNELYVTELTNNSAKLNWTGAQTSYNVRFRELTPGETTTTTEDFEHSGSMPTGWTMLDLGDGENTAELGIIEDAAQNGTYGFRFSSYDGSSSGSFDQYLISSELNNITALSFAFKSSNGTSDKFRIGYSTTTNDVSAFTWGEENNSASTWTTYTEDVENIPANAKYFAINYTAVYKYRLYIDNITYTYTPMTAGAWNTDNTNVNSELTINNLTQNTKYEWQVQGINSSCDGDGEGHTGVTEWSEMASFTTFAKFTKTIAAVDATVWAEGKGGYYLIASPLAAAVDPTTITGMTSGDYDLYAFDQEEENEWCNYKADPKPFTTLANGKGYLYANKAGVTLTFVGPAGTNGTVTLDKTNDNTVDFQGWNLVGNPFGQDAYITKACYTLENSDTYTVNNAGTAIHAMQGLLVEANSDGETLTFSTEAPAKKAAKLNMNVSKGHRVVDHAIISFNDGQQLPKLQFRKNSTKVYMAKEGIDYAIVSAESNVGEMPVNFKAENNGTYTLSFTTEEVSFAYLHLIDNMTGNDVDLLANPSYSFNAKTTDYESRFKLVFATGNNSNDDTFAFYSNGNFIINNEGEATLQVIDINGRILKSESINGCANINVNAAQGIYMLRLVNGDSVKVQKVVVR